MVLVCPEKLATACVIAVALVYPEFTIEAAYSDTSCAVGCSVASTPGNTVSHVTPVEMGKGGSGGDCGQTKGLSLVAASMSVSSSELELDELTCLSRTLK